jgi:glucose-6-phosphate isomerase
MAWCSGRTATWLAVPPLILAVLYHDAQNLLAIKAICYDALMT